MKKWLLNVVVAICVGVMLGGCSSVPVLSDSNKWDHSSPENQLAWLSTEADNVIKVIGTGEGWYKYNKGNLWSENRDSVLANLKPRSCRPNQKGIQPGKFQLDLDNGSVPDPFEAAKRVRAYWTEQGWTITDVVPLGSTKDPIDYFRADREDGAVLALTASEFNISLQLSTSCSDNNMTN